MHVSELLASVSRVASEGVRHDEVLRQSPPRGFDRSCALDDAGCIAGRRPDGEAISHLPPGGVRELSKASLFPARHSWTMPAIHRGLLYVTQNEPALTGDTTRRLLCYDLRGE